MKKEYSLNKEYSPSSNELIYTPRPGLDLITVAHWVKYLTPFHGSLTLNINGRLLKFENKGNFPDTETMILDRIYREAVMNG